MVTPRTERAFRDLDLLDRDRQKLKAEGMRLVTITQHAGRRASGTFFPMAEKTS